MPPLLDVRALQSDYKRHAQLDLTCGFDHALGDHVEDGALVTAHSLTLTGLASSTTYYYRATSADAAGNAATTPPLGGPPASFTTPAASLTDTTVAGFGAGAFGPCLYIGEDGDGEILLAPTEGTEFSGAGLDPGWSASPWNAGGGAAVGGGLLAVNEEQKLTRATNFTVKDVASCVEIAQMLPKVVEY